MQTFTQWKAMVDAFIYQMTGCLTTRDLPHFDYQHLWETRCCPYRTAREVLSMDNG